MPCLSLPLVCSTFQLGCAPAQYLGGGVCPRTISYPSSCGLSRSCLAVFRVRETPGFRVRRGVFAHLRAPCFSRALARLRTRRPGYRTKASPAPGSPFFCRLSSFLSFLLPFLLLLFLNPWLSERIRDPKKQCLRSTRKLAGIEAQRGRGPGNHGPHAP